MERPCVIDPGLESRPDAGKRIQGIVRLVLSGACSQGRRGEISPLPAETGYGELREPFKTTTFWLDGSLKLSAVEQIEILKKIYTRALPFSAASYDTLRQIMLVEQTPGISLRAKTGLAGDGKPQVGWYVGYIETAADVWFFALNMEVHEAKDIPLRLTLTREILRSKGVID